MASTAASSVCALDSSTSGRTSRCVAAIRPCLEGLVIALGPGDRTCPHHGRAASPLRVSAGISPDFAGSSAGETLPSEARRLRTLPPDERRTDHGEQPPTEDPLRDGLRRAPSLVVVNTGDGKGKSSAAFGVMVRASLGAGKVAVVQFVKSGEWKVGEEKLGRQLGSTGSPSATASPGTRTTSNTTRRSPARAGRRPRRSSKPATHQLVILDELTYLCTWGGSTPTRWSPRSATAPARQRRRHRPRRARRR